MANEKNLIPMNKRTPRERKEIARKGAIASNKAQAARKTLKEELLALLEDGETQKKISVALIQQAKKGNTKAYEIIRDSIGEKPIDKVQAEVNSDINITIE